MTIALSNYRDWLPFAFIIAGVVLALVASLFQQGKQRRQKTRELLESFSASLREHDLEHWKELYRGTREVFAAPAGHFISREGKPVPLVSMWTSGQEDHTAIQRMAESLEKLCAEMLTNTVDVKMMWYEIGQLMEAMHGWLEQIPGVQQDLTFLEEQYPSLRQVFKKYGHRFKKWPYFDFVKR
jgi:hypothetical protein